MVREKDILNGLCKADSCSVPDGYFALLQARLVSIPSTGRKRSTARTVVPYLAIAASMGAVGMAAGLFFQSSRTAPIPAQEDIIIEGSLYEDMLYADALPRTYSLENFYEDAADQAETSVEDYYEYINQ